MTQYCGVTIQMKPLWWDFYIVLFNPLSPNSDQHQLSPNNIHMFPREMVMRVNKMITKAIKGS